MVLPISVLTGKLRMFNIGSHLSKIVHRFLLEGDYCVDN